MKGAARISGLRLFYFASMPNPGGNQGFPDDSALTPHRPRHSKRKGELSELAFLYKAAALGFGVAKPYGDSERYDFILDSGERLWRVQVKSTYVMRDGVYRINTKHNAGGRRMISYLVSEIDVVIAHVVPEDAWFVIPVQALLPRKSAALFARDDPRVGVYSQYREAWSLMSPER